MKIQEKKLIAEIKKKNLSAKELALILKGISSGTSKRYDAVKIDFPDNHLRFGVFSDIHIGHICYRGDIMRRMVEDGRRFNVEFWLNAGDTIEGMSGREGHIYELSHLGYSAQVNFFEKEFSIFEHTVYSIEAQNSHSGWYKSKGNTGLNIGEELERRSRHYKFIGYDEQDIILDNGLKIRLVHPGSGTAYAISYKIQKYVNAITGGHKPNILFQGHYHKAMYMFYRNIHCFDAGCICDQTPFMKKIGTPAMVGYWLIDVTMQNNGVERIISTFVPFYE